MIAGDFGNAHPLVEKTKQFYDRADAGISEPFSPPSGKGYLNVSVSPAQARRALLITDAILKAAEKRGYEVIVSLDSWGEKTLITKEGEDVRLSLHEHARQVRRELTPEEKKKPPYLLNIPTEYQSDGKLTIKVDRRWGTYQRWNDRKNEPLEDRLNDVVAGIVALLESQVAEKRRRAEEERRRQEIARQKEEESRRRERLEADVHRWRKSEDIRAYLDAYEARLIEKKGSVTPDSREAEWLRWAREYAAGLDPLNKIFSNAE